MPSGGDRGAYGGRRIVALCSMFCGSAARRSAACAFRSERRELAGDRRCSGAGRRTRHRASACGRNLPVDRPHGHVRARIRSDGTEWAARTLAIIPDADGSRAFLIPPPQRSRTGAGFLADDAIVHRRCERTLSGTLDRG
jgi:hypothetical protein